MPKYEYKVVPAPKKGVKSWGLRSSEDRFATALAKVMNDLAGDGWEYQRSDTLPCEEKSGLRGKSTVFQNMLIFRREVSVAVAAAPVVAEPDDRRMPPPLAVVAPEAKAATTDGAPVAAPAVPPEQAQTSAPLPVFLRGERGSKNDVAAE